MTACGSEEEAAPGASDGTGEPAEAEEAVVPPENLSGLVLFHKVRRDVFLTFHDLGDGGLNTRVELTGITGTDERDHYVEWDQFAFSPGFRHVVYQTDMGLVVGSLDDETRSYTPTATIQPVEESTFGGGTVRYQSAQFTPDGEQIWFIEHAEHGEDDSRVLAVDTTDPEGGEPEHVGDVPRGSVAPSVFEGVPAHGRKLSFGPPENAYAITEENEIDVLTLVEREEDSSGDEPEKGSELDFLFGDTSGVVPSNFLRGPNERYIGPLESDPEGNQHTQLSLFTVESDGSVEDDEVILETEGNPILRYWYDPEGERLLLRTSDAYYLTEVGGSGEPQRVFDDFDYGEKTEGGTAENSLGVHPPHPG